MSLIYAAVFFSALSFITGIITVGSGTHFKFARKDILLGRRDAILYIWITCSSIFALAHCASLLDYGITFHWGYRNADTARWMVIHSGVGILLTSAHLFVKGDLKKGDSHTRYLWGRLRYAG